MAPCQAGGPPTSDLAGPVIQIKPPEPRIRYPELTFVAFRSAAREDQLVKFGALVGLLALVSAPAMAHQPVTVPEAHHSLEAPFEVPEPEISKAFFGKLGGQPEYYRIVSTTAFRFYAGITVPRIEGCPLEQRFSFDVLDANLDSIVAADGERFDWWPWYERFGQKWYWVGPEIGAHFKSDRVFAAGTYYIRVFNADNTGRYVLAVGHIESFPLDVIARTLLMMPGINRDFWDSVSCKAEP